MRGEELGAIPGPDGTTFRVWSTTASKVGVRLFHGQERGESLLPLEAQGEGRFELRAQAVGPGALYKFVLDGDEIPDPYARSLPYGVHGPAGVVARTFDPALPSTLPLHRVCTYELHVGTFTPEGTFAAAAGRLADLVALGVGAIELMPVAAFAGSRGWGYDGVAHFAPQASYGTPDDLRTFVRAAHRLGLGVLLDVVYNHFGPSGNYLARYSPEYFAPDASTPWGQAPNYAHPRMRAHVLGSARMWLEEYGFDGLRLDATHAIVDRSARPILADLRAVASACEPARVLVAEDDRNDPKVVTDLGMDAIWADDFHHTVRVLLTGERDGYYAAYEPTVAALAHVIERGWSFEGSVYPPWRRTRGEPADRLQAAHFVYCVENHDQAGNRAFGERLSQQIAPDALCAATALLLFLPMSPLLFMGQEWAASTPFLYFTDHDPELGQRVRVGRREEFKIFRAFADPADRERIPDPQSLSTFEASKLRWEERSDSAHARVLTRVQAMLRLRREDRVLREPCERKDLRATADRGALRVERGGAAGRRVLLVNLSPHELPVDWSGEGTILLATGDADAGALPPYTAVVLAPSGE